ncbi:MAG: hypothetical protein IPO92_21825 [Saprospiraceae bacterium]|nr:hypothetical protein [Saprospiraceae bacterium]
MNWRLCWQLYFNGYSQTTGNELCEYDPSTGEVRVYADINPGNGDAYPERLSVIGDRLYLWPMTAGADARFGASPIVLL